MAASRSASPRASAASRALGPLPSQASASTDAKSGVTGTARSSRPFGIADLVGAERAPHDEVLGVEVDVTHLERPHLAAAKAGER